MFDFFKNLFKKNKNYASSENLNNDEDIVKLMYLIDRPQPTVFFVYVREMVGYWLQQEMNKLKEDKWHQGAHWIKMEWTYPCFEQLTFAYKNQIFCVVIEIIDKTTGESLLPQKWKNNLIDNCIKNNLIPCLYKVSVKDPSNPIYNTIKPITSGWNLFNAITNKPIIPENVISDAKIEISEWELNDFAIQVVREYITNKLNYKILSYQNIIGINPQLWFEDENKNMNYVVVRYAVYPNNKAERPNDLKSIQLSVAAYQGYFASVAFFPSNENSEDISKIYRGEPVNIVFNGLEKLEKLL